MNIYNETHMTGSLLPTCSDSGVKFCLTVISAEEFVYMFIDHLNLVQVLQFFIRNVFL